MKTGRYESLDAIRAFAAIGIVLMHVLGHVPIKTTSNFLTTSLIPFFCDFVLMFMIISAFSLSCGYYLRIKQGNISINEFYKRRYLRILPFFAILCLVDVIVSPSLGSVFEMFANLTLCFGFLPNYGEITVIGVGWFLGIIFMFYMLFPFFVFLIDNIRRAIVSFILSFIMAHISIAYFESEKFGMVPIDRHNILVVAPFFLIGGICYLYREGLSNFVSRNKSFAFIAVSIITVIFFCFPLYKEGKAQLLTCELILFSMWLIWALGNDNNKLLVNPITKYLGNISMEIYLCHMMIYRAVEMCHIDKYVKNGDLLYLLTSIIVLGGAILFSHIIKYRVMKLIIR